MVFQHKRKELAFLKQKEQKMSLFIIIKKVEQKYQENKHNF